MRPIRELTPRELELLQCLADDYFEREAAEEMGLRKNSTHVYSARIRQKLGVRSIKAAIATGFRRGWLK